MTRVRCILVETTVPVRILPRMETKPVNGHFLSRELSQSFEKLRYRSDLTDIAALDGSFGSFEAQPNVLVPSPSTFSHPLALCILALVIEEDVRLLLISPLRLNGQFGRHGLCGR